MCATQSLPAESFAGRILTETLEWSGVRDGHTQSDDITLIVVDLNILRFHPECLTSEVLFVVSEANLYKTIIGGAPYGGYPRARPWQ